MTQTVLALLLGCHRAPAPAAQAIDPATPAVALVQANQAVLGPAWWESPVPGGGRLTLDIPAGFAAAAVAGWLVVVRHLETRAELRVGQEPQEPAHPGYIQVFSDADRYRSGPAGDMAGTETWIARDLGGSTLVAMWSSGDSGLYTELDIPLHAELVAWAAFAPVMADLRVEP